MSQEVKFNWIGPSLLSIIPWIALEISELNDPKIYKKWMATGIVLTIIYSLILLCINLGQPKFIYQHLFSKFINWNNYYQQIDSIATNASLKFNKKTVLIPLDKYNIASELSYYQAKNRNYSYKIIGRSIFGQEDLMYKTWSDTKDLNNKNILLISDVRYIFDAPHITSRITALSPVKTFWVKSQGANSKVSQHYYQIAQFRD
jgi:dolichol-phosphate mannosyltransferase